MVRATMRSLASAVGSSASSRRPSAFSAVCEIDRSRAARASAAAPRANIRAASPFTVPKDWRAALGFLTISALAAGLAIPQTDRTPHLFRANPERERPGKIIKIEGEHLMTGVAAPIASRAIRSTLGAPGVPAAATAPGSGYVPSDANVYLGTVVQSRPITVLDWTSTEIKVKIPDDAPIGPTKLMVFIGGIWVLQGLNIAFLEGSFMAGDPQWAAYGAILALVGIGQAVWSVRRHS